ncbi:M1 family metallopeptidase [Niabella insulamsoli]|uniref:M1 family metallopeptidase n=1 Tax=Niabella insulamsoli TaxID=3144874 RepID=UPI0031FE145F
MHQTASAQLGTNKKAFSRQDTLRGTSGPARNWWNVQRYDINVKVDIPQRNISGFVDITFKVIKKGERIMQIDLQQPMELEKAVGLPSGKTIAFEREGNVYWLDVGTDIPANGKIRLHYLGHPKQAKRAPWDGGWIFAKDAKGRDWISVACQGLGASVWYPCKDHQSDEPDSGASLAITVPDTLVAVGNGRLLGNKSNNDGTATWTWQVKNPINNYNIIPYIGKYVNFSEKMKGLNGELDLSYWVLDYNLEKAKKQFAVVPSMMRCFEDWMGPYPFYEDSYKLIDAPHLGMEHQSGVAYGNKYGMGYLGKDLSGSGWGLKFDFIIIHESGHEWFANNITSKDIADMWIHESFTNYTETMFVECQFGKQAGSEYVIGSRKNIANDIPIIGVYGVNEEGSGDMYYKGANMLHTIRQVIGDRAFKQILRGLNKKFYHQTVTTRQVEEYMSQQSGTDLSKIFDQYLRTTKIPELQFEEKGKTFVYKWTNVVDGFDMPVQLTNGKWLHPTTSEKSLSSLDAGGTYPAVKRDFYINTTFVKDVSASSATNPPK